MILMSSFIAGFVGVATMIYTVLESLSQPTQPQYVPQSTGYIGTQYTPQSPPTYNFDPPLTAPMYNPQPIQQPVMMNPVQPMPTPAPTKPIIPDYQPPREYMWGSSAYINAIANTPLVPQQNYVPYYQYQTYANPQPQFPCSNQRCEYNVDWSSFGGVNMNQSTQTSAAPPGYQYQGPIMYKTDYGASTSNMNPQYSYSTVNDMTAHTRTYANGSTSFCKVPDCYDSNGSWKGFPPTYGKFDGSYHGFDGYLTHLI